MKRKVNKKKLAILMSIPIGIFMSTYVISRSLTYDTDNLDKTKSYKSNDDSVKEGVKALRELESVSVLEVQKDIDSIKTKGSNKLEDYDSENVDYNNIFNSSVIMGDSRAEGLIEYDILSSSSVIAKKGRTTLKAMDDVSTVVDLAPSNIIMTYGMNDLTMYNNPSDFIKSYEKLIKDVQNNLPQSKIYITSIFPVQEKAIRKNSKFNNLEKFNIELKNMCANLGIKFIDVGSLDSKYYEPDGIHFKLNAYPTWLNSIAKGANL